MNIKNQRISNLKHRMITQSQAQDSSALQIACSPHLMFPNIIWQGMRDRFLTQTFFVKFIRLKCLKQDTRHKSIIKSFERQSKSSRNTNDKRKKQNLFGSDLVILPEYLFRVLNQHLNGSSIKIPLQLTDGNSKMLLVINLKAPCRIETIPMDKRRKVVLHVLFNVELVNSHAVDSIQRKPA